MSGHKGGGNGGFCEGHRLTKTHHNSAGRNGPRTNLRQQEAGEKALSALKRALTGMQEYEGEELVAVDLRSALNAFGEIVGETTSEDLLTRIFSEFCIGK